jgi:hypothetical protein
MEKDYAVAFASPNLSTDAAGVVGNVVERISLLPSGFLAHRPASVLCSAVRVSEKQTITAPIVLVIANPIPKSSITHFVGPVSRVSGVQMLWTNRLWLA